MSVADFEPIVIGVSDEERRRREEQRRRDEEARRAASEALDSVGPALAEIERGAPQRPADVGAAPAEPAEPYRGSVTAPHAQTPGARVEPSGSVALQGEPQTRQTIREHQQARGASPMAMQARPEAPSPRMDVEAVGSGSDPDARIDLDEVRISARPPEERGPSPTFRAPMVDPRIIEDAAQAPQRQAVRDEFQAQRETMGRKPAMPEPGRMDDGLPNEGQIGDARARDIGRMIAAALGNAFAGYSGRGSMVRPRREADELTQQRQQGIARQQAAKGEAVQRMDARAEREAQREQEMTLAQQRLAESAQARDAGLDIQRQRLGLDEQRTAAQLAEMERTRSADSALDVAESVQSRQARTALAVRLSQLHPTQRQHALEALGASEAIQGMTGRQAMQAMEQLARPLQMRGTGGGGGGTTPRRGPRLPGGGEMGFEDFSRLFQERTGRSAEEAELVYADRDAREQFVRGLARLPTRQASADGSRRPMLPGVDVDAEMVDDYTYRRHREGLIHGRHAGDSLRSIRQVQQRYGASAVIDPRARAELAAPLQRMLTRIAQMRSSGVIQPSELPTIEAFLPDPSSGRQITIGEFDARMGSFVRDIENDVRATLEADGATAEGIENALRYVRGQYRAPRAAAQPREGGGAPQPQAAPAIPREARRDQAGNVVMYGPDGPRRVPPGRVAQRQDEGWTFEEGGR